MKHNNLSEFNPFDYMETQAEIEAFLNECLVDEDPNTFIEALGLLIKKHGVSDVSQATGLNRESLYKSFGGKVKPKFDTVVKVLRALDLNLEFVSDNHLSAT